MYVCVPVLLIYSLLILLCSCLRRKSMRTQQGLRLATMQVMYHAQLAVSHCVKRVHMMLLHFILT